MRSEADRPVIQRQRIRFRVNGIVQGVGFRPFVYRLATSLGLSGRVSNNSEGVLIETEGAPSAIEQFHRQLLNDLPAIAKITRCELESIPLLAEQSFTILLSERGTSAHTLISPDIATCDDCLKELLDPEDRRYRYPFINCTNCGPRYTIVERIPYDRSNTSMRIFPMCPNCQREYDDPANRRFHAQPNACPVCGPKVTLWNHNKLIPTSDPICEAITLLKHGKILAIRGIGGFHLAVDPRNESAVAELRKRKGRAEKPFALMARDVGTIRNICSVSVEEEKALNDRTRPIVLLRKKGAEGSPDGLAPRQHSLGFMLPYAPLHYLLLDGDLDLLVMTSGNFSEEPIAIGDNEAKERLAQLADYFLLHDREILQRCDDSIVRVMAGQKRIMRRSRGFVPQPLFLKRAVSKPMLAVGGELKNTIGLARDDTAFLSQHIGDLDNPSAFRFFQHSVKYLEEILELTPELIVHDLHPEYLSTKWARSQSGVPTLAVQHHHAHLASVMAENEVEEPCIGIILDGTGYGTDGTIWGGEILVGNASQYERASWLEPVPMPGGEAAIKQPWRMGLSYLRSAFGGDLGSLEPPMVRSLSPKNVEMAMQSMERKINAPMTSSCGRLFDGVAAILGVRSEVSFEAQAAMELEAISGELRRENIYHDPLTGLASLGAIPTAPLVRAVVHDLQKGTPPREIGAKFHATLVEVFVWQAKLAREKFNLNSVALSGGVYQNLLFFEYLVGRLNEEQFTVWTHAQVPTNDGGIALGQIAVADALVKAGKIS